MTYTTVYIAGPMRGIENYNFEMFDACRDWVHKSAWFAPGEFPAKLNVISPADEDRRRGIVIETGTPEGGDYHVEWKGAADEEAAFEECMRHDLPIVARADRIYLLPGWQASRGALAEVDVALACGVEVWQWTPAESDSSGQEARALQLNAYEIARLRDIPPVYCGAGEWRWPTADNLVYDDGYQARIITEGYLTPSSQNEVRITDPETGAQKGQKLDRYDLIPVEPLRLVARHYGLGARKYADRNWEKGYDYSLSYGAAQRHLNLFWSGENNDVDPELGEPTPHLAAAIFHLFALMEFVVTHPEKDDRANKVTINRILAEGGELYPADVEVTLEDLTTTTCDHSGNGMSDLGIKARAAARDTEAAWTTGPPLNEL